MNNRSEPTRDEFLRWRSPVRGNQNPQRMDNPLWKWCVQNRGSAYAVNQHFDGPDSSASGPCWCFDRMGQAHVELPDGRVVYVAGEHEDHYDPDFYIYNDVVIVEGDDIQILGYPETDFPPTDFHSATLAGSDIILIGNLAYPGDRVPNKTQVLSLGVDTWQITPVETLGAMPGWIHGHTSELTDHGNAIVVTGGKVCGERLLENFDDYHLCLKTLTWTKLTDRQWGRWILERKDGSPNSLWEIRTAAWHTDHEDMAEQFEKTMTELSPELASELTPRATDQQVQQIETLYQSPFNDDLAVEDEERYGRHRLDIEGTTVRIDEDMYDITITVEGQLPAETLEAILSTFQERLARIEDTRYTVTKIDP